MCFCASVPPSSFFLRSLLLYFGLFTISIIIILIALTKAAALTTSSSVFEELYFVWSTKDGVCVGRVRNKLAISSLPTIFPSLAFGFSFSRSGVLGGWHALLCAVHVGCVLGDAANGTPIALLIQVLTLLYVFYCTTVGVP